LRSTFKALNLSKDKARGALKGVRLPPKPHPLHEVVFLKLHILELKRSFPPKNSSANEEDGEVIKAQAGNPFLDETRIFSFPIRRD
jgi:hypothetical protein